MTRIALTLATLCLSITASAGVPQDIKVALVQAVTDAVGDPEATVEVTSWKASRPELVRAARALDGVEILPGEQPYGHVTARARLIGRDGSVSPVFVLAEVAVKVPVWVVTRIVAAGAHLEAGGVTSELRPIQDSRDAMRASEALDGRLAARALRPGMVLRAAATTTPVLVRRGERVSVRVVVGSVRITSRAEALASGRQGDRIRVRLSGRGPVVDGQVSGLGKVEVSQ